MSEVGIMVLRLIDTLSPLPEPEYAAMIAAIVELVHEYPTSFAPASTWAKPIYQPRKFWQFGAPVPWGAEVHNGTRFIRLSSTDLRRGNYVATQLMLARAASFPKG